MTDFASPGTSDVELLEALRLSLWPFRELFFFWRQLADLSLSNIAIALGGKVVGERHLKGTRNNFCSETEPNSTP